MSLNSSFRYLVLFAALLVLAGTAAAQGPVSNASSTTSDLAVTANVQTALQLDLSQETGGVAPGGSAGVYTLDLGDVNGLGIGAPATGVTKAAVSGGYLYTTPIRLTPSFSGFSSSNASIKVEEDAADGAADQDAIREGSSTSIVGSTVQLVGGAGVDFTSSATNGTPITRYIGIFVRNDNNSTNANAGSRTANLVYTISVP